MILKKPFLLEICILLLNYDVSIVYIKIIQHNQLVITHVWFFMSRTWKNKYNEIRINISLFDFTHCCFKYYAEVYKYLSKFSFKNFSCQVTCWTLYILSFFVFYCSMLLSILNQISDVTYKILRINKNRNNAISFSSRYLNKLWYLMLVNMMSTDKKYHHKILINIVNWKCSIKLYNIYHPRSRIILPDNGVRTVWCTSIVSEQFNYYEPLRIINL